MFGDITALASLLSGDDAEVQRPRSFGASAGTAAPLRPSDLHAGPTSATAAKDVASSSASTRARRNPKDIWSPEELEEAEDALDTRKRPEFDILLSQHVGAEDVYLGMGGKTPASMDCESMCVRVRLPGERIADIEVEVQEQELVVKAARHKLRTYLPHRVKHKDGSAKWDEGKQTLSLTLPLHKTELF